MPVMRIVMLLLVVGGLTLFALSNLSPTLSLVFLGMKTPALPIAGWIGIAIAAGAITSFFLQLLSYLQSGYSPGSSQSFEEPDDIPPRSRYAARRESRRPPEPEPQIPYTPPPPSETPRDRTQSDWEESNDENWDFDEEPVTSKSSQEDFNRQPPRSTPQTERTSFEAKQEPKTGSQTGSVYSYSYRERDKKESGIGQTDQVYDANYRVIAPPHQKPPEPEDDDDWGFEEDEDFDEGKGKPRRG
ncbi:MAG TPA: hypothetical protein V6D14_34175 [Coleofasciculaceae cyanobacterium]